MSNAARSKAAAKPTAAKKSAPIKPAAVKSTAYGRRVAELLLGLPADMKIRAR